METIDAFLGGKVQLKQSELKGTSDSVLLAAAVPANPEETVLDVGTGNGVVSLCLNARVPGLKLTGIDCQKDLLALAEENAKHNQATFTSVLCDIGIIPSPIHGKLFHHVVTNPPFYIESCKRKSNQQAMAYHQKIPLKKWLCFCLRHVRAKGSLTVIHKTESLPEILSVLQQKLGGIEIFPVASKDTEPAKRVIVRGRMNSHKPLHLYPPLVMHDQKGKRTTTAEQLLRKGMGIDALLGLDF